jgi:hypothetical protein
VAPLRADVMEATVNRALSRGQTMQQALGDKFFGPQNRGKSTRPCARDFARSP